MASLIKLIHIYMSEACVREAQGKKGVGCLRTEGVWGNGEKELNSRGMRPQHCGQGLGARVLQRNAYLMLRVMGNKKHGSNFRGLTDLLKLIRLFISYRTKL